MTASCTVSDPKPRNNRSRITNGKRFLPGVHSQSVWARLMRDKLDRLLAHCGGEDNISETRRSRARRASFFETELVHIEQMVGKMRAVGEEPDPSLLDLYSRMANSQRRDEEVLGWDRTPRDVTSIGTFLKELNAE